MKTALFARRFSLLAATAIFTAAGFLYLAQYAFASSGDLDFSFSGDGKLAERFLGSTEPAMSDDGGRAIAVQPDGKIIVAGRRRGTDGRYSFALIRYNVNGTRDASFGDIGKVATDIGEGHSEALAVVLQPDGRIVAGGISSVGFSLVRYEADGSLDVTFGTGGIVETPGGVCSSLALQADGKILAAGYSAGDDSDDFMIARYESDGSPDASFGDKGIVRTDFSGGSDQARAVSIQSDGRIVAAGIATGHSNLVGIGIARYRTDGTLDRQFDRDGKLVAGILFDNRSSQSAAYALAIQPDGKIITGGTAILVTSYDLFLMRFHPNGERDYEFGSGGEVWIPIFDDVSIINNMLLQPDGKVVAAGYSVRFSPVRSEKQLVLRLNVDGSRDRSFGDNGFRSVSFNGGIKTGREISYGVALDDFGRIIIGGESSGRFSLARILCETNPNPTVSISGRVVSASESGIGNALVTLIDQNGITKRAYTGVFGYFRFDGVQPGAPYSISAAAPRYIIPSPNRVINVDGDVSGVNFAASERLR